MCRAVFVSVCRVRVPLHFLVSFVLFPPLFFRTRASSASFDSTLYIDRRCCDDFRLSYLQKKVTVLFVSAFHNAVCHCFEKIRHRDIFRLDYTVIFERANRYLLVILLGLKINSIIVIFFFPLRNLKMFCRSINT